MGGAVAAIEQGFYQDEIHEAAFRIQQAIEDGDRVVVGVNRFQVPEEHAARAAADRRGGGRAADRAAAGRSGPRGTRRPWTPRSPTCGGPRGHREPAAADEGGAAGARDPRRGVRRAPRRVRRVPPELLAHRRDDRVGDRDHAGDGEHERPRRGTARAPSRPDTPTAHRDACRPPTSAVDHAPSTPLTVPAGYAARLRPMDVAIVGGTGAEGFGLALRLAHAGHRRHDRLTRRREAGARGRARRVRCSVRASSSPAPRTPRPSRPPVVIVTVPFAGAAAIYGAIERRARPDAVVVDCTSPLMTAVGGRRVPRDPPLARLGRRVREDPAAEGNASGSSPRSTRSRAAALRALDRPVDSPTRS